VFAHMRKIGFGPFALGSAVTAIFLVPASAAFAAAPAYDLHGTWSSGPLVGGVHEPANGTQIVTQMNMATGEFSGTAEVDGEHFELAGSESGNSVEFTQTQIEPTTGYVSHDKIPALSILPDGNIGGNGSFEAGEFWMEVASSSTPAEKEAKEKQAKEEAAKKAKEESEKAAKRPTATAVTCNYEFATSTDTCTAQVADAGAAPEVVPTGTVTFTNTGAGGFPYGTTCTITASASAPGVPFCSVIFLGGGSGLPMITASYGGDSHHSPSTGSTSFAQFGPPEETGEEFAFGGPDQFPETVTVETEAPVNGTTVDTSADQQTGQETDPPDPNSPIGMALDSIPKIDTATLDPTGAQRLTALAGLVKQIPYSEYPGTAAQEVEVKGEALLAYARQLGASGDAAQVAQAESLYDQLVKVEEAYERVAKATAAGQTAAPAASSSSYQPFAQAARARSHAKPREHITLLGSVLERDVHAGKLKIKLHLKRAEMRRLARTHKRLTVYLWIQMRVPSKVIPGGLPVVIVKKLTLRRG
jgi:hypothetical protein